MTIYRELRRLDAAPEPTPEQITRAQTLLERIVADDRTHGPRPLTAYPRRTSPVRATVLLTAAAVALVAVVAPNLTPLSSESAAVASWTPTPSPVSLGDLRVAEQACRQHFPGEGDVSDTVLALSERRGDVVALLYTRQSPHSAFACVLDLPAGSGSPREVATGWGSSSGRPTRPADTSYLRTSEGQFGVGGQALSVVYGAVGADVASVVVRAPDGDTVATIANGMYAAWFPGPLTEALRNPGRGEDRDTLPYDLILRDGTHVRDATSQPAP